VPYEIELTDLAFEELDALRAFDRRRIVDEMEEKLTYEPMVETRNRKQLRNPLPRFAHVGPVWELKVGSFRVIYNVSEELQTVYVRSVRQKKQGQTTQDVFDERGNS
jgi:mRNA-degrading endonuclease RelE of RelBE toxin-antitoxin system